MRIFLGLAAVLFSTQVEAAAYHSFGANSVFGEHLYSQGLSYDGGARPYTWGVDGSFLRQTSSQTTGPDIVDLTYQLGGRFGYRGFLLTGFQFSAAYTPKEKLSVYSPGFYVGKKFYFSKAGGSADGRFHPSITPKFTMGFDIYRQTTDSVSTTTTRRRTTATTSRTRSTTLVASKPGLSVSADILSWLSAFTSYRYSFYNKSVSGLVSRLDSLSSVSSQAAGLASTYASFTDHSLRGGLEWLPLDALEIETAGSLDRRRFDKRWVKGLQVGATYEFTNWLSVSAAYERSMVAGSSAENLGHLGVGSGF